MAGTVTKPKAEIPTIDVSLVTIQIGDKEFGFDTSNKVSVKAQTNTTDAVQLIIKGKLKAQKKAKTTLTGNQITLTDNVFNTDLAIAVQGGTAVYDATTHKLTSYTPAVAGKDNDLPSFVLNCYSAQYDAAGKIVNYEKISYPNCTGQPVAFSSEDGTFRAPEYTIDSAPADGEAPYTITYVEQLPTLTDPSYA